MSDTDGATGKPLKGKPDHGDVGDQDGDGVAGVSPHEPNSGDRNLAPLPLTGLIGVVEAGMASEGMEAKIRLCKVQLLKQQSSPLCKALPPPPRCSPLGGAASGHSDKGSEESLYACCRQLGLCLHCGGEGHLAAVCPSKRSGPSGPPAGEAKKAGAASRAGKKPPFKKGMGLQVEPCKASSASEEADDLESSDESVENDSDLA
uniref:Uncharacterized protein n=1 Tax=Sphaerodactylus townsendi TaxID=933632 RepID=A0ACB8FCV1_9SAUR